MAMPATYLPNVDESRDAHTRYILSIRVSANYITSASSDGSVRVWFKQRRCLALPPLVDHARATFKAVALSEELGIVFGGNSRGGIAAWRLSDGVLLYTRQSHTDIVLALAIDKTTLVSASRDQTAIVWQVGPDSSSEPYHLRCQHTLQGHSMAVLAVQLSDDHIYTSAGDKSVRIWDRHRGTLSKCIDGSASMAQFQIRQHMAGIRLLGACTDNTIRIYDVDGAIELACLHGHTNVVRSIEVVEKHIAGVSSQDLIVASASYDGTVRVWSIQQEPPFSWQSLYCFSFSDTVLTPLRIREPERNGEPYVAAEVKPCRAMDLQVDGDYLYCCGESAEIITWTLPSSVEEGV